MVITLCTALAQTKASRGVCWFTRGVFWITSTLGSDCLGELESTRFRFFLTLWKDADPDIPIPKQAKVEYAKLQ